MTDKAVVSVNNITKIYKLYKKPFDRVKESLLPFHKTYHKKFYALNGVSLTLKRGEALGIIGRNGNGKSTLLKIISGVLSPTKGSVSTNGRISAILELTSNLKLEMTGRENIIYNLKLQGFTSKQLIKEKTKEIEDFADIGEFIDQPVKTYSSGMKSRLGFGIATSVEPDILILDEVLAVGDFNFQQKCLAKINAMRENISMIFVSHSMNSVRLFCDTVLVLEKGKKAFYGKADDGIKYYLEQEEKKKEKLKEKEIKKSSKPFYGDIFHNEEKISNITHYWIDINGNKITRAETGTTIGVYIQFKLNYKPHDLVVGLPMWDIDGNYITGVSSDMDNFKIFKNKDGFYEVYFLFENIFNPANYLYVVSIVDKSETLYRNISTNLEVFTTKARYFGFVTIPHTWKNSLETMILNYKHYKLIVDSNDKGGLSYDSKSSYEEINNKIYKEINAKFSPGTIIDIGANYGFISLILSKIFNNPKVVMIEASTKLIKYIDKNMKLNGITDYKLYNAICAEVSKEDRTFSQNPWGSQDNRVIGENEKWKTDELKTISIDDIIASHKSSFYFIKIDTQGYEPNVFKGGELFLQNHNNWIVKTEFAPYWLESQGFSPKVFLEYLIDRYIVSESPNRTQYKGNDLYSIIENKLTKSEIDNFIEYTVNHNKNKRGWCDLFVFPKNLKLIKDKYE